MVRIINEGSSVDQEYSRIIGKFDKEGTGIHDQSSADKYWDKWYDIIEPLFDYDNGEDGYMRSSKIPGEVKKKVVNRYKNKFLGHPIDESLSEEQREIDKEPRYRVYDVSMDIAIPGSDLTKIGTHGSGPNTSELYRNLSKALLSVGYEMAGDIIEVNAELTDDYANNDYKFFSESLTKDI